ncbi:hypothetical protein LCGC14_2386400 [marine sediment metagenome]|uniref:Uncharacterized protein n=1 Tax=marine sediment metagenome TaxID=412755 RepID=A0A0F9EU41_9ZZZZ
MVVCTKCGVEKLSSEFNKDKYRKNGLRSACRLCTKTMYKKWISSEEGQLRKSEYDKERYHSNIDSEKKRMKKWRDANPERHRRNVKLWREKNPDRIKEHERNRPSRAAWYRKKRREDINFRIAGSLRSRLRAATRAQLAGGSPKKGSAIENLGCTMSELIVHLENQFQQGMSWENYGEWHIDHVKPLSSFDLLREEQVKEVCHFANLQPLWSEDNLRKGNKV